MIDLTNKLSEAERFGTAALELDDEIAAAARASRDVVATGAGGDGSGVAGSGEPGGASIGSGVGTGPGTDPGTAGSRGGGAGDVDSGSDEGSDTHPVPATGLGAGWGLSAGGGVGPPTDVDDGIGANDDLAVNAMDTSGEFTCQLPFPLTNAGVGINGTRVSSVTRDMAGFHHGIQEGDELVSIGGMKVGSRLDVGNAFEKLRLSGTEEVACTFMRS